MSSKNLIFTALSFLITNYVFSQENSTFCSKRNKHHSHVKSNSLTVSQIAETEKYDVKYYNLDLNMTNTSTFLSGTVKMGAVARESIDSALFELFNSFTITDIRVNGLSVNYFRNFSAITVPVNVVNGDYFIIETDYYGNPPTAATNPLGGGGMTHKKSQTWGNHVVWSLSEPFSAYEWFPVKQSLKDKIDSSDVSITVPDTCKAGSNGILASVDTVGNGYLKFNWKNRHMIDYYLISVAVAKYVEHNIYAHPSGLNDSILVQNYIYDNPQTLPYFLSEINETSSFIELFSDLYGLYPFADEKYGHCMAPISGGMEHQTMTTQGFFEKTLTSHELAHQWWGDHVTCASWSDIWVNEGWASYSEYLMLENLYPSEKTQHMSNVHNNVMSQTNGSVWCLDSLNEGRIFDGRLTYDKGGGIIHTMRFIVNNDSLFFSILKDFQNIFKDSLATGIDFKNHLEQATGIDFDEFFEQWYFGEGFPTYSLKWKQDGNNLLVNIRHTTSASNVTPLFTNPIDVKFTRQNLSDTVVRFDINSNNELFTINNIGTIGSSITIDPDNWIINKVSSIVQDNSIGISELQNIKDIVLFPNPNNGLFQIQNISEKSEIVLYSMNGQKVYNKIILANEIIDIQNLAIGNYLLEVKITETEKRLKLISIH
jgi:aminopeptidase N